MTNSDKVNLKEKFSKYYYNASILYSNAYFDYARPDFIKSFDEIYFYLYYYRPDYSVSGRLNYYYFYSNYSLGYSIQNEYNNFGSSDFNYYDMPNIYKLKKSNYFALYHSGTYEMRICKYTSSRKAAYYELFYYSYINQCNLTFPDVRLPISSSSNESVIFFTSLAEGGVVIFDIIRNETYAVIKDEIDVRGNFLTSADGKKLLFVSQKTGLNIFDISSINYPTLLVQKALKD